MTSRDVRMDAVLPGLDGIVPVLRAEADESERLHRPTPAAQVAIRDSGILELMVPRELGGHGADPLRVIDAVRAVTYADPATGWLARCLMTETAIAATHLPDEGVAELFGSGEQVACSGFSAGQCGVAVRNDDGSYTVSGTWKYAPGASMATHVNLPVVVEGSGEELVCVTPKWTVSVHDRWEMLGLQGSASFDIEATDVVVPAAMTYRFESGEARRDSVVGGLTPTLIAAMNHGAWSVGLSRRMLDELRVLAQRSPRGQGPSTAGDFYPEYARRHVEVRAAMALLRETWRPCAESLARGEQLALEAETMVRLAALQASRTAVEVAQMMHRFAGAHITRNGTMQRLFRDAHTGAQHRDSTHDVVRDLGARLIDGPEGLTEPVVDPAGER